MWIWAGLMAALASTVTVYAGQDGLSEQSDSTNRNKHRSTDNNRDLQHGVSCPPGDNDADKNSFLWTVTRNPPSYLFGTIHVPYTSVWEYIPDNTKEAFYNSQFIVFELDLMDPYTISALNNCQLLPDGKYLIDVIPRSMHDRIQSHLQYVRERMPDWMTADQKGRGLYADYLFNAITGNWERKRPVYVMLMINALTEVDIKSRGTPVLDLFLAQEAHRLRKRTEAVEAVEEHCIPLNTMDFTQVLFALNHTLTVHEQHRNGQISYRSPSASDLIGHYNCGDLDAVLFDLDTAKVPNIMSSTFPSSDLGTARQIDTYFREELINKRNDRMALRIERLLQERPKKSFFFAFGAGHFLGNQSVIGKLQDKGIEVHHTPANVTIPMGKKRKRQHLQSQSLPPLIIGSNIDYLDPLYDRQRNKNRQRHERGKKKNRHRQKNLSDEDDDEEGEDEKGDDSNSSPFHELWVKSEASSPHPVNEGVQRAAPFTDPSASPKYAQRSNGALTTQPLSSLILLHHLIALVIISPFLQYNLPHAVLCLSYCLSLV